MRQSGRRPCRMGPAGGAMLSLGDRDGQVAAGRRPAGALLARCIQAGGRHRRWRQVSHYDPLTISDARQSESRRWTARARAGRLPPRPRATPCLAPAVSHRAGTWRSAGCRGRPRSLARAAPTSLLTRIRPTLSRTGAPSALAMSYRRRGRVEMSAETITQPIPMASPANSPPTAYSTGYLIFDRGVAFAGSSTLLPCFTFWLLSVE